MDRNKDSTEKIQTGVTAKEAVDAIKKLSELGIAASKVIPAIASVTNAIIKFKEVKYEPRTR